MTPEQTNLCAADANVSIGPSPVLASSPEGSEAGELSSEGRETGEGEIPVASMQGGGTVAPVDDRVEPLPKVSTPANDIIGGTLAVCGMAPGIPGEVCAAAGELQNETIAAPDKNDPTYNGDKATQNVNRALALASLAQAVAPPAAAEVMATVAGPVGLVAAGGTALGHGAQALGEDMIKQGIANNPGQTGPDPMMNIP